MISMHSIFSADWTKIIFTGHTTIIYMTQMRTRQQSWQQCISRQVNVKQNIHRPIPQSIYMLMWLWSFISDPYNEHIINSVRLFLIAVQLAQVFLCLHIMHGQFSTDRTRQTVRYLEQYTPVIMIANDLRSSSLVHVRGWTHLCLSITKYSYGISHNNHQQWQPLM
jgi:hypothetical protein